MWKKRASPARALAELVGIKPVAMGSRKEQSKGMIRKKSCGKVAFDGRVLDRYDLHSVVKTFGGPRPFLGLIWAKKAPWATGTGYKDADN